MSPQPYLIGAHSRCVRKIQYPKSECRLIIIIYIPRDSSIMEDIITDTNLPFNADSLSVFMFYICTKMFIKS